MNSLGLITIGFGVFGIKELVIPIDRDYFSGKLVIKFILRIISPYVPERIKLASTLPHRQALVVGDRAHWTTTLPANHHVSTIQLYIASFAQY